MFPFALSEIEKSKIYGKTRVYEYLTTGCLGEILIHFNLNLY